MGQNAHINLVIARGIIAEMEQCFSGEASTIDLQRAGYHECRCCGVGTWNEDICSDCLEEFDSHAIEMVPARKVEGWSLLDIAVLILLVPVAIAIAVPILTFICQCIQLWTGHPWP
jgi:hypothetical protein